MNINFFEEFPDKENLEKLKLIKFPCLIFVASGNLFEFNKLKNKIKKINKKVEVGYWPLLEKSYWVSPFSYTLELKKLVNELEKNKDIKFLIDLEYPLLNKSLFFRNLFCFFKNKKIIREINKYSNVYTTAMPLINKKFLGLRGRSPIIMLYTSMIKNKLILKLIKRQIKMGNYNVGLGTIAPGILGNEPKLSPNKLGEDLEFCKRAGIKEVFIFRLGGLNKYYIEVINKYLF